MAVNCFQYLERSRRPSGLGLTFVVILLLTVFLTGAHSRIGSRSKIGLRSPPVSNVLHDKVSSIASSRSREEKVEDIDVVGFGEDCSPDGPFCDIRQHLTCDFEEEACICNSQQGYMHRQRASRQLYDEFEDHAQFGSNVCVGMKEVEERREELMARLALREKKRKEEEEEARMEGSKNDVIDIVGFGEDCSPDGPFCDIQQHLACDSEEEACVCDGQQGYIRMSSVPGLEERDAHGVGEVCVSKKEIEDRTEELLRLKTKTSEKDAEPVDLYENEEPASYTDMDDNSGDNNDIMKRWSDLGVQIFGEYDEERLERFKLDRIPLTNIPIEDLIVDEILKYDNEQLNLKDLKALLQRMVKINFSPWNSYGLSRSICQMVFDVDQDGVFSHPEYVIFLLSKSVSNYFILPRVYMGLVDPSTEQLCVLMEDLQLLDHDPDNLAVDFRALDLNNDGCFSFVEFENALEEICRTNWLSKFLHSIGLADYNDLMDPSPEEMYIRRLLQHERLHSNWKLVDANNDGFISKEELSQDLNYVVEDRSLEEDNDDVSLLMTHLDKDVDEKISIEEVLEQRSRPDITEDYQFEWLESLYELYETDEAELKEYLEVLQNRTSSTVNELLDEILKKGQTNRIFNIFDRNRNGELDQVELKLLMEMLRKYVVNYILNQTVDSMDLNSDGKITLLEYEEFFVNTSLSFRIHFRNLLADELDIEEHDEETEEYEDDEETVSSIHLSRKASSINETSTVRILFGRLDANSDGHLTKEDFLYHLKSTSDKKSDEELKQEFSSLDMDKDGLITSKDVADLTGSFTFEEFKDIVNTNVYSEEVSFEELVTSLIRLEENWDLIVQSDEFSRNKISLFNAEDEAAFLSWVEEYLGSMPSQVDADAEVIFKEFDYVCDGFISIDEFKSKLKELQAKSFAFYREDKLTSDADTYFKTLDLNMDGKVSFNEFRFLLLRINVAHET